MKTKSKPETVAAYFAALSPDKRACLQGLRTIIRAAVPGVDEVMSYGMPGFRLAGKWVTWIGAGASHCAIYGISGHQKELAAYDTSGRGTVRFPPDDPLPAALVRKLVKARVAALQLQAAPKRKRPAAAARGKSTTKRPT